MRIRQVKPAFWSDVRIAGWPAPVRLFYVGLWMQADDAGWLRWDVPQIAFELYGFEPRTRRERNVTAWGEVLEAGGRIERHPCGHAFIPRMKDHQRLSISTKQVRTFQKEHEACHAGRTRNPAGEHTEPRPERNVSLTGTERASRNVMELVAPARSPGGDAGADDEPSEFQARVPRPA